MIYAAGSDGDVEGVLSIEEVEEVDSELINGEDAFILAFSVILLNTNLHNPSNKEERRMTREGFIRNNRGICEGKDLPDEVLNGIFDRIKINQISLKEDDDARVQAGIGSGDELDPSRHSSAVVRFFINHYQ